MFGISKAKDGIGLYNQWRQNGMVGGVMGELYIASFLSTLAQKMQLFKRY